MSVTPIRRSLSAVQPDSVDLPFLVYAALMQASAKEPALQDDPLFQQFVQAAYDRFVAHYEVV